MKDENGKVNQPKKVDQPKKGKNETLRQSVMFTLLSLSAGLVETGSFVVLDLTSLPLWLGPWNLGNLERFVELHPQQEVHI